jgi:RsiW-degrading membrane proteinase PrsW (M82 family)
MPQPAGFPPILAVVAVLACAALLAWFYQALFPRRARWPLVGAAFVLGMAITGIYAYFLPPASERLIGIVDAWTALKAMALAAGLPEEAVKLAATLIALALFRRGVTPAEAFQTALVVALGFAALENLQYARALPEAAVPVAFGRGIVASFVHSMMAMFQGTFLAALVRSGWRRWDYLIIGYAVAALAHSLFDWSLVRPLLEYFRNQEIRPETLMEALPIAIPSVLGVVIASLILFVRQLKLCGREDSRDTEPAHLALRRRWRKVGNIIVIVGIVGLIGSIIAVVIASQAMQGQPQPTDLSQVSPDQLRASIIMTVVLVFSPMLILFGILVRQKQ